MVFFNVYMLYTSSCWLCGAKRLLWFFFSVVVLGHHQQFGDLLVRVSGCRTGIRPTLSSSSPQPSVYTVLHLVYDRWRSSDTFECRTLLKKKHMYIYTLYVRTTRIYTRSYHRIRYYSYIKYHISDWRARRGTSVPVPRHKYKELV